MQCSKKELMVAQLSAQRSGNPARRKVTPSFEGLGAVILLPPLFSKGDKPVLGECLASLREGDTLIVTRADRIARSASHLLATVQALKKKDVTVRFLDQPELNTEGKYADFLLTVLAAVGQLERDIMDEKRRDGIAAARANGVKFGRPGLVNEKLRTEAKTLKESGLAMPEIARRLKLGVSTTYRLLAEEQPN
jgi:DNA invertase Pin-like site-specific DNA recombinase